jgi:hypothetical protein
MSENKGFASKELRNPGRTIGWRNHQAEASGKSLIWGSRHALAAMVRASAQISWAFDRPDTRCVGEEEANS